MRREIRNGDSSSTLSRRGFLGASVFAGGVGLPEAASRIGGVRSASLDVRDFGGVGDGRTKDTEAIQHVIDFAHQQLGGGVVQLSAGTWLSGTLHLRSYVTLEIASGAVLLASPDDDDFADHEG